MVADAITSEVIPRVRRPGRTLRVAAGFLKGLVHRRQCHRLAAGVCELSSLALAAVCCLTSPGAVLAISAADRNALPSTELLGALPRHCNLLA